VLETGLSPLQASTDEAHDIRREVLSSFNWPNQGLDALDEYKTEGLCTLAFPCLFPFGVGDPTDPTRERHVSLKDSLEHLCRYTIYNEDGSFEKPFDSHARFMHYMQDMDERQRAIKQSNFYLKKCREDANMSLQDIIRMQQQNGLDSQAMRNFIGRFTKHAANMCGSDAYFKQRRRELQSLIEQKGPATLWFTLSFAESYWKDMLNLYGPVPAGANASKYYYQKRLKHPALLDEYFTIRVKAFVKAFYGPGALESDWHWYRYEW